MRTEDKITALTVLSKRVAEELKAAKAAWQAEARPKQRDTGMIGERVLGTVGLTAGRETIKVTDKAALLEWAKANRPDLLSYDPHIAEDDVKRLIREVETTGDLPDGMGLVTGEPFASVRLEKDAPQVIEEAVAAGSVSWSEVLAVES